MKELSSITKDPRREFLKIIGDKVFKSGLSKFFKGCLPQNLLSPLLNTQTNGVINDYFFDQIIRLRHLFQATKYI